MGNTCIDHYPHVSLKIGIFSASVSIFPAKYLEDVVKSLGSQTKLLNLPEGNSSCIGPAGKLLIMLINGINIRSIETV